MLILRRAAAVMVALAALALAAPVAAAVYSADLSGPAESPPVASPGTGSALITIDTAAHTLRVEVSFADLIGTTAAAHIHGPTLDPLTGTAGVITAVPTFPFFPLGVTSGSYDMTFDTADLATFNPTFVTNNGGTAATAEAALAAALDAGKAYLNIHTSFAAGGEIRGFLTPVPVPAGLPLLATGLVVLAGLRRRSA